MSGEQLTKPSEILSAAADLIEQPGKWTQYHFGANEAGVSTLSDVHRATCFCLLGAIDKVRGAEQFGGTFAIDLALEYLPSEIVNNPDLTVADWNDEPNRTAEEVAEALRQAAEKAREQGQ